MKQFSVKETRKDSKGHKTTITINTEDVKLMKDLLLDVDDKQTRTSGSKAKAGKKNGPKELPKPKPTKPRSNKKKK